MNYSASALQTFCDACWAAFTTLHAASGATVGSSCFFDWASVARIGLDGKYDPLTQNTIRKDATPVAGGGVTNIPWNTALVVSLRTAKPRGYCSNGRFYYPCTSPSIAAGTGRIPDANVASRIAAFKMCFDACNTAAATYATNLRMIVASKVGGGAAEKVTAIRSDGRLDSIERRENKQVSTWSVSSLAP